MITEKIVYGSRQLPLKIGDIHIGCYMLHTKEYLLKKSDLQKALNYDGKAEDWILDILAVISKFTPVSNAIMDAYENPIIGESTIDNKTNYIKGVKAAVFIETCKLISNAKSEGYLNLKYLKYARAAQNILNHLENQNLYDYIDVSIGFVFLKESIKSKITTFLFNNTNDGVFLWVPTIHDDAYEALLKTSNMQWVDFQKDTRIASKLVFESFFDRMPMDLLLQLRNQKPKRIYTKASKKNYNNQYPAFHAYISTIFSLMNAAGNNRNIFLRLLNKAYPKNPLFETYDFNFLINADKISSPLSIFDQTLKKSLVTNKAYSIKKRGQ